MKIMRADSRPHGWVARGARETMRHGNARSRTSLNSRPTRRPRMQWTTPTARDFRFGFEITLYVAAR